MHTLPDDKFRGSLIDFVKLSYEPREADTYSLSQTLEELDIQQTVAKMDLKKLKLKAEEAGIEACINEREFHKKKEMARSEIKKKIHDLKDRFDKYLQEKEAVLMEELDRDLHDEELASSQSVIQIRSVMESIENKEELLEKCNVQSIKSQPKAKVYRKVLMEMSNHMSDLGSRISNQKPAELDITFKFDPHIEGIFTTPIGSIEVRNLGKMKAEEEQAMRVSIPPSVPTAPPEVCNYRSTPFKNAVYLRTFPSLLPQENKGYVVGIAWVPPDRLLLVDKWDMKLKLFHDRGHLISVMVFDGGEPTDIVYTKGTAVRHLCLVTIPNGKLILQVAVEDTNMRVSSRISTATGYSSIAYDRVCSRIICGVCQPYGSPRIDVVSANGAVQYTFATDRHGVPLFACPRSVDILLGTVAGCDWQKNRILFMARDGSIQGTYHGSSEVSLLKPVGTTPDGRGHLLVADSKRNRINIVSHFGGHLGSYDVGQEVQDPREICMIADQASAKLAISHGAGYITIYELNNDLPPAYSSLGVK
jgi:hypothetical protein